MTNNNEDGATFEEIFNAVYFPESIKWENKEQQELWDKITKLTDKQAEIIWERIERNDNY